MEHLTREEKIKIRESMSFKDKLELMKILYELAILYKNGSHTYKPIVDDVLIPLEVKNFMINQGFVFYNLHESENNKLYSFEFIGEVGE